MSKNALTIKNLSVAVERKTVVSNLSLDIKKGEVHVLMGSNGSGKSSLTLALAGHPRYSVINGRAAILGRNILKLYPEERAKAGLFLAFQHPISVPGVPMANFLRLANSAIKNQKIPLLVFRKELAGVFKNIGLAEDFVDRDVNSGFSGGEQRRGELASLLVLEPKVALLDEIDSGLDVDCLKATAKIIENLRKKGTAFLIITHTPRLLKYLVPTKIHVMQGGNIVLSGGNTLLKTIEEKGFKNISKKSK